MKSFFLIQKWREIVIQKSKESKGKEKWVHEEGDKEIKDQTKRRWKKDERKTKDSKEIQFFLKTAECQREEKKETKLIKEV